ncbi:MAG: putative quinol monooxygenase [Capsulimonadales bacterium]|nr:putative quinol monooxygenase [Capsulimonadales bacterium]
MHIVCVTVKVKPGQGAAFEEIVRRNREATRKEPGNIRFDVLKGANSPMEGEPEEYFLFEVYRVREDFTAHQQTPHYLAFRDAAADLMAEPRRGVHYVPVDADPFGGE